MSKRILVVGATGAQGMHVIPALLAPSEDGKPSPYSVRALTRDPESRRAKILKDMGVELFKGTFENIQDVIAALQGCYGCFINTDTYTVGEEKEIYCGVRIYEAARRTPSMRHFVYSGLDYSTKIRDFNPIYQAAHHDAKGIVGDYLSAQKSDISENGLVWTNLLAGPYFEMLSSPLLGPLNKRADGTVVFASPIGNGHVPFIALADIGWWARYTLDHRETTSGKELKVASEVLSWDQLVETFSKVTGIPSVHRRLTLDEWFNCISGSNGPVASEKKEGDGSTTIRQSFSGFFCMWRDDVVTRDMEWVKSIHPKGHTFKSWLRWYRYEGKIGSAEGRVVLKNAEDGKGRIIPNREVCKLL